ncbi:unnamed protein product [Pylaiella littoralis]
MPSDSEVSTGETQSHGRGFLSQPHSSRSSSSSSCVPIYMTSRSIGEHLRVCVCRWNFFTRLFRNYKGPKKSDIELSACSMFDVRVHKNATSRRPGSTLIDLEPVL